MNITDFRGPVLEPTVPGKSVFPAHLKFQCGEARPPSVRSLDSSKASARHPRALDNSRVVADGEEERPASRHPHHITNCIRWHATKTVLAPVFENKSNRLRKIFAALFECMTLSIRPGYLRRPADEPLSIALNDGSELVAHKLSIDLGREGPDCSCNPLHNRQIYQE